MCYEWNNSCSRLLHVHVPTASPPTHPQLRRRELRPLENHDSPPCSSVLACEESAAFEGRQLTFSGVKRFRLLFNFAAFPHAALRDDSRPVQEAANSNPTEILQHLRSLKTSARNTLSVVATGRGESWLLFHWVTGIPVANAAVIEGLYCQLPAPTSQAPTPAKA